MIYSELQATVSATGTCDLAASGDPVGLSYVAKTIGPYPTSFLAYGTVANPGPNCDEQVIQGGYHTIDFNTLYSTPIVMSTTYKAGCTPEVNPRLSLPRELSNVDPAWKTCEPLYYGAFDPPSVLRKASRLAPAQADPAAVTPTPPPVPASPAAAQATPAAQTPTVTPAPNNDGRKTAAVDPPAPVMDTNDGNGDTPKTVATHAAPPINSDPHLQEAGADKHDPSGQMNEPPAAVMVDSSAHTPTPEVKSQEAATVDGDPGGQAIPPAPAVVANPPVQNPSPGTDPNSRKEADGNEGPSGEGKRPATAVLVNSPVQSPASAANVIVAQGTTLTENGPPASIGGKAAVYSSGSIYVDKTPVAVPPSTPVSSAKAVVAQGQTLTEGGPSANVGGKAAVYSAGSIYLESSTPIAVPKAEGNNVVVAQGQTLTEHGPTANIGGKAAVYSAGSVYYDSTPILIPKASPSNVVVAQGQTLSENGPSAVVEGKTALYKAGSIYYDSTPVAVPTPVRGQQNTPPVVAAGVTFAPTVQNHAPVVTNGITFVPAVEKVSPVVAGGITFAPVSHSISGDSREPVVAGGITFHPSFVRSSHAVALETPAPLLVDKNPVLKAANGGLIVAGSTIAQGFTTSLLGHVIAANFDNVVVDGTTHSIATVTAYPIATTPTATPLEIANRPVLKAANGDLVIAGSTVSQGSATSLLGHAISVGSDNVVLDGTTRAFGPVTAQPLQTPAPLEIANQPVMKAANGDLVIAGTTIPPGVQTSLLGHAIYVGTGNDVVVDDGKTLTFASSAGQQQSTVIASLIYGPSSDVVTTLTPGATYSSGGYVATYTGSTPSAFTEATSNVIGTATLPLPLSSSQVFVIEAAASATPEQLFVEASPSPSSSAVEYALKGKTATVASESDVPLGGLIIDGFRASSAAILPSLVLVNGTAASSTPTPTSAGRSSSPSGTGSRVSPSRPVEGMGSRVLAMGCWWSWTSGYYYFIMVLGYVLGTLLY